MGKTPLLPPLWETAREIVVQYCKKLNELSVDRNGNAIGMTNQLLYSLQHTNAIDIHHLVKFMQAISSEWISLVKVFFHGHTIDPIEVDGLSMDAELTNFNTLKLHAANALLSIVYIEDEKHTHTHTDREERDTKIYTNRRPIVHKKRKRLIFCQWLHGHWNTLVIGPIQQITD